MSTRYLRIVTSGMIAAATIGATTIKPIALVNSVNLPLQPNSSALPKTLMNKPIFEFTNEPVPLLFL
jgi:hypothetical protein